jgi:sigma-B regulation protein RsbU (phosphoserine phosphatase)
MARNSDQEFEIGPTDKLNDGELKDQLTLKNRALAATAEGITIADARLPDCPIIYANEGFERLTGYSVQSIIGRNCRFLQGSDTDPSAIGEIRRAVTERRECAVEILNYRKDGTPFWNRLSITPVKDSQDQVTHFIGIQSDITSRRVAEDALRNAKLELEETNQRMRLDLEMAARIQKSLLPASDFRIEGIRLAWLLKSCDELAGDTLGVIPLDPSHLGIYILDVSGHGVSASLLSFTLNRWLSLGSDQSPLIRRRPGSLESFEIVSTAEVAEQLNRQFPMDSRTYQYFTLLYGILDKGNGEFRFVAAGHPAPVLVPKNSNPLLLEGMGLPVGILPDAIYREEVLQLEAGDRLYLYTDGITEAMDSDDQEFGIARLLSSLKVGMSLSLKESVSSLVTSIEQWCGRLKPRDDITVLGIERES